MELYYKDIYCRKWFSIIKKHINETNIDYLCRNSNLTWNIILDNLDINWNWKIISQTEIVTWDIVCNNPYLPVDFACLCKNSNISWDIIKNNPEKLNNFWYISQNPNITIEIIENNFDLTWNWECLSNNYNIPESFIDKFIHFPWNLYLLSQRSDFIWEFYLKYRSVFIDSPMIEHLSSHKCVTIDILNKYKDDINWDWTGVSYNPNITWEFIIENLDKDWEWTLLSCHNNISIDIILDNPEFYWNYDMLSYSYKVNFNVIKNNTHIDWNNKNLGYNPNISIDHIINNDKYNWSWDIISKNDHINLWKYDFNKISDKLNWNKIGLNYYIYLDFLKEHEDKLFNNELIMVNNFNYDKNKFIKNFMWERLNIIFRKKLCSDVIGNITTFLV